MRAKITYAVTAAVLVVYFVLVGSRGILLIETGTPVTIAFGVAVLVLPAIGLWFLWKKHPVRPPGQPAGRRTRRRRGPARRRVEADPSGRIDRDSADAVFAQRKAETEDAPDDWRTWFRLAVAYHDARDTPRARKAMQRAIALHDGRPAPTA